MAIDSARPRIAVFAGANATILNSAPLVTSNKARRQRGLPLLTDRWGRPIRYDLLRPQRLAAPVTVFVEQHSAHPLEIDADDLYGEPDGYLDPDDHFHEERLAETDRPVYRIELTPDDGLYPLPYMAVQVDGSPWDDDSAFPVAPGASSRQSFYPDASRVFEEIDRLGWDEFGASNLLGSEAEFEFHRVLPSGGYTHGLEEGRRTDVGSGDIAPEAWNFDFFPYRPPHLRGDPPRRLLARVTNRVAEALDRGEFVGALWLEASPAVEETLYWLNLLIDTTIPIVGVASSDWPHGCLGAGGDRNLVHAVRFLTSRVWADEKGINRLGAVLVDAERAFTARDVQKADARPGGFIATGGHGGIVASIGDPGPPVLTFLPVSSHTLHSEVRMTVLPRRTRGVSGYPSAPSATEIEVTDPDGYLLEDSIPHVSIFKHARYLAAELGSDPETEVEIMARIEANLAHFPLAGFVAEANAPYGSTATSVDAALRLAALSGMPVVRVGRGNPEGMVPRDRMRLAIAGSNLTATKARLLLMACLLRFGATPPAVDPVSPTAAEIQAVEDALAEYQGIFDTH